MGKPAKPASPSPNETAVVEVIESMAPSELRIAFLQAVTSASAHLSAAKAISPKTAPVSYTTNAVAATVHDQLAQMIYERLQRVAKGRQLVTSATVEPAGGHDLISIWNRGALAGTLTVAQGDGVAIASLLTGNVTVERD